MSISRSKAVARPSLTRLCSASKSATPFEPSQTTSASKMQSLSAQCVSNNQRISLRPVRAVHRVEPHVPIADMDLQSIAIVLQLVCPIRPSGRLLGVSRLTGINESGRRIIGPAAEPARNHASNKGRLKYLCECISAGTVKRSYLTDNRESLPSNRSQFAVVRAGLCQVAWPFPCGV